MSSARRVLLSLVIALLLSSVGAPALAWSGCGSSYVVQWGDTLGGIAMLCGTSVWALRQANPGLGSYIYAGQTLWMPGSNPGYSNAGYMQGHSHGGTYVVGWGDTLRKIATRLGLNVNDLIAANPQLWNPNLIFPGQVINLPGNTSYGHDGYPRNYYGSGTKYTVCWGDTLRIIADRFGTTVDNLMALNPQILNPHMIYAGQVIRVW
jgi:LysM repeat protein